MAEAAARKHEDNKCSLVDSGCASQLVEGLRTEQVRQSSSAVQAVCACLKSLTTADDPKPAASRYPFPPRPPPTTPPDFLLSSLQLVFGCDSTSAHSGPTLPVHIHVCVMVV